METANLELPLFPLPNVVHFPETDLPLHIFEPRYRQLVADLEQLDANDRLVGMVVSGGRRGEKMQIYRTGTAGRLVDVERLDDGRSNIVLHGCFRFNIERELSSVPYRQASVTRLPETSIVRHDEPFDALLPELERTVLSLSREMHEIFPFDFDDAAGFCAPGRTEALVNNLASLLDLTTEHKMKLLGQELPERTASVLRVLRSFRRSLDLLAPYRHLQAGVASN